MIDAATPTVAAYGPTPDALTATVADAYGTALGDRYAAFAAEQALWQQLAPALAPAVELANEMDMRAEALQVAVATTAGLAALRAELREDPDAPARLIGSYGAPLTECDDDAERDRLSRALSWLRGP